MEFKIIADTPRSITIELVNDDIYVTQKPYDIYINGNLTNKGESKNVLSFFGLKPNTEYEIKLLQNDTEFIQNLTTKYEYVRLNVRTFGAKGDGENLDSIAIQSAILSCPKDGTVYIPKGTYLCTPLFLKSHITIEFEEGARLLGHTNRALYPILPGYTITTDEKDEFYLGTWEGNPLNQFASLITGIDVENVSIVGRGILDGNAASSEWWINPKLKKEAWRPRTLYLKGCDNVLVQGITVTNSPSWTIHPYLSTHLSFVDLIVVNPKDSPNTDGLDPESCSDVKIIGVDFSVGDDCIAIKSGKLYMGKRLKRPSERLLIRNCRMRHGHGAVVIGSEMSGGANHIEVSQCIFEETDRGLRIKTRRGRGKDGIIDNIVFDKIFMKDVLTPFVINMFYFCDPDGKSEYVWSKESLPLDEWTPYLGRFSFSQIRCEGSEVAAAFFMGLPEQPIEEVLMEDIYIEFKEKATKGEPAMMSFINPMSKVGIVAEYVKRIQLKNVVLEGYVGERITLSNVKEINEI